jgi:hypothetical protein
MVDSLRQFCPWCDTDIVWDQEIGPEDTCPHCLNELSDHRSIQFELTKSEDEIEFDGDFDQENRKEPVGGIDSLYAYEEAVRHYIERQDEQIECGRCNEHMVFAGTQDVGQDSFVPHIVSGFPRAFAVPPFSLKIYICSTCFKVEYLLSEEDRMEIVRRLVED